MTSALTKRVTQAEAEITESLASLFEDLRDAGHVPRHVDMEMKVNEIRRPNCPLTWQIRFDMRLGTLQEP